MASINQFQSTIEDIRFNLASLGVANPTLTSQLNQLDNKLNTLKTLNVNYLTSNVPTLGRLITDATTTNSFLGPTIAACPLFKEYMQKLDELVDENVISPIVEKFEELRETPTVEKIEEVLKSVDAAIDASEKSIEFLVDTRDKFNLFVQEFNGLVNMLRNPCAVVTTIANSVMIGELNPSLQRQANKTLDIIEEIGEVPKDINNEVQKKISAKVADFVGFKLEE